MSYEVPERSEWDELRPTKSLSEVNEINHMHCLKKRRN